MAHEAVIMAVDTGAFSNVRGTGSLVAVTLPDAAARDRLLGSLFDHEVFALPSGPSAIRFRLPYVIQSAEIDTLLDRLAASL